jgi:hypothetical protein
VYLPVAPNSKWLQARPSPRTADFIPVIRLASSIRTLIARRLKRHPSFPRNPGCPARTPDPWWPLSAAACPGTVSRSIGATPQVSKVHDACRRAARLLRSLPPNGSSSTATDAGLLSGCFQHADMNAILTRTEYTDINLVHGMSMGMWCAEGRKRFRTNLNTGLQRSRRNGQAW